MPGNYLYFKKKQYKRVFIFLNILGTNILWFIILLIKITLNIQTNNWIHQISYNSVSNIITGYHVMKCYRCFLSLYTFWFCLLFFPSGSRSRPVVPSRRDGIPVPQKPTNYYPKVRESVLLRFAVYACLCCPSSQIGWYYFTPKRGVNL